MYVCVLRVSVPGALGGWKRALYPLGLELLTVVIGYTRMLGTTDLRLKSCKFLTPVRGWVKEGRVRPDFRASFSSCSC